MEPNLILIRRLELEGFFELKPKQDFHTVVDEHAQDGWRLVQILTPPIDPNGKASFFELIFEKQV